VSQVLAKKKFVLYYAPEFVGGERITLEEMSFFTEDKGFRDMEIGYINKLKKGGILSVGSLKIWRVA